MSMKNKNINISIISSAILLALSSGVYAESDSEDNIETIVVTASGYEQNIVNAAASISVVTREDLESHYYRDLTDALTSVPGVVVTGGGDLKDISIRGMGAEYTLILVDGKRLATRLTRPNSDRAGVEAGWLPPLESIERIEVIKGPMSTLYGSDAMGGVINIITRKSQQKWGGKVQIGQVLQEDRDSGDETSVNIFLSGPVTEALSLQVFAQDQQRDEDNIINGYADKSLKSVGTKLIYQLSENHEISLEAGITHQEQRHNSDKSYETSSYSSGDSYSASEYDRKNLALTHQGDWKEIGKSNSFIQFEETDNPSRSINIRNTEFKSTLVTPFTNNTLSTGMRVGYEELNDDSTNTGGDITRLTNTTIALFAEDEWRVLNSVALTAGVRYDHDKRYGSHLSPRLYSVWNINNDWTLKGGISTGFRAPEMRQTSSNWVSVSGGGNRYGNPDLEPETSITEEMSINYQNSYGFSTSIGVFNNDFNDMISTELCTVSTCDELTNARGKTNKNYINIDEAVTRGVEASIETPLSDSIDFSANYTYTYSKQETGDSAGDPLNNLPKHLLSTDLRWQASADFQSWIKLIYHGEESVSSGSTATPDYTFVDTGMTYALTDKVTLKGAVYNLLDKEIDYDTYSYVEDGRRYWMGVDISF